MRGDARKKRKLPGPLAPVTYALQNGLAATPVTSSEIASVPSVHSNGLHARFDIQLTRNTT
jgi:hypothetical protein